MAFNLQGHWTLQVIPVSWLDSVDLWHTALHMLAGVCYVIALLLFPDGKLGAGRRATFLLLLTPVVALLATATTDDHVGGLLLVFGIFIPITALTSQVRRFRHSQGEQRQQSKILLIAMTVAIVAGVVLVAVTTVITAAKPALATTTRNYELRTPAPGTYFFRCDPHPSGMFGTVIVERSSSSTGRPPITEISAEDSEFDKEVLRLPANQDVVLRFTNEDGDGHNVSIYQLDPDADPANVTELSGNLSRPVFLGDLFAGQDFLVTTFRAFRIVFALIPIAIFVGILRFRLWDIDHLVNRALVYTILTGALVLLFFAATVILGSILRRVTGQESNDIVTTISTLGVAALFSPGRRTIQRFIDRRFYRRRYNAITTLEEFTAGLRDQVNVKALEKGLLATIDRTMQPAHVSLVLFPSTPANEKIL